jgi:FeS assembly protein IscX
MVECLTWDDSYAIALALMKLHPAIDLQEVSYQMIYQWTIELPEFCDDPQLVNDGILAAIYLEWFEEANSI